MTHMEIRPPGVRRIVIEARDVYAPPPSIVVDREEEIIEPHRTHQRVISSSAAVQDIDLDHWTIRVETVNTAQGVAL